MEITFEISSMYGKILNRDPTPLLNEIFKSAAGHIEEHVDRLIIEDIKWEVDDIYHVTLFGPREHLFPVFDNLHRWFAWRNLEDPVLAGRFTRIIL